MDAVRMSRVWQMPARLIVFVGLAFIALSASALDVPPLTGRVVDLAHVLPVQESEQLTEQLRAHEEKTGNQVAVLILPSLEGEPVEEYSHRVATTWKLGQKGIDNGVLLLIALKERKLRIEVGYGLEGTLTDLRSAHIIRNEIVPQFRNGDIPGGIRAGTEAILATIEGTYQAKESPSDGIHPGREPGAVQYVIIGIVVGFLAGILLSQGLRRARALLGSVLTFMVAQLASIPLGLAAAGFTAFLLWMVLRTNSGRRRGSGLDDWTWYSSRGGGWSGGSSDSGGFSGGGGDFGGGGASGDW
jgi:uncharacterized protein